MKVDVVDKTGKKVSEVTLDKKVFGQKVNRDLLTQYIHVYRSNKRQGTSATKTRAEVSGGGKKPWKQKGTGRARHGSRRSPLWVHGGIAHGPKPKSWQLSMPKKMKKATMISALSEKYVGKKIFVVDHVKLNKPSTKKMKELIENLNLTGKTLVVLEKSDANVLKSTANVKQLECSLAQNINAFDLISSENVLFAEESLISLQERIK